MPFPALHTVEHVVDAVEAYLIANYNAALLLVYQAHKDVPGIGLINLQRIEPSAYYKVEAVEPKALPACYILADETTHDLTKQNYAHQVHVILVGILCEDKEYQQLTRKVWRYAEALFNVLHDASVGKCKLLVERVSYGPTVGNTGDRDVRHFRKDVMVRVRAVQFDSFSPLA